MRKKLLVILTVIGVAIMSMGLTGCGNSSDEIAVEQIDVVGSVVMIVGQTKELKPIVIPYNAANKSLKFQSNNVNVVTVDDSGVLTAVSNGSAIVSITAANGIEKEITVTVSNAIEAIRVTAAETNLVLKTNNEAINEYAVICGMKDKYNASPKTVTAKLSSKVLPAGTLQDVKYTSSDESVATVDNGGQVTFAVPEILYINPKEVTITATSVVDGTKQGSVVFKVDCYSSTKLKLSKSVINTETKEFLIESVASPYNQVSNVIFIPELRVDIINGKGDIAGDSKASVVRDDKNNTDVFWETGTLLNKFKVKLKCNVSFGSEPFDIIIRITDLKTGVRLEQVITISYR